MSTPLSAAPILSTLAGDPDMGELIQSFVDEIPERVRTLTDFWQRKDLDELKCLAHQLKGSGGGYGFPSLSTAAGKLELCLAQTPKSPPDLASIARQVDELVALCSRVRVS